MRPGLSPAAEAVNGRQTPLVSVILAVRDEARYIEGCLDGLAAQDYPAHRLEVILLDGCSQDDTVARARSRAESSGLRLRIEANPGRTAASGFNLGLSLAQGEIIVKVDGHTRVAPDFISASVRALCESGADVAGGRIRTLGEGKVGRAIALAMASPFGVGNAAFRHAGDAPARVETDSVPFGAYRREVFERLGGFTEAIPAGEDDEFNYRLRDAGGRVVLSPDIHSDYYARGSLAALWLQYWRYGLAKAEVLRRHPRRLRARHLVPSAFVLSLAGGPLLALLDRRLALSTPLAAAAYAVANLLATWRIARRGRWAEAPLLPLAFACIHLAAGCGMLAGGARVLARILRRRPLRAS